MGSIDRFSQIEEFRRRRHGTASRLVCISERGAAGGYTFEAVLSERFYITKAGVDANTGVYQAKLVFDRPAAITISVLERVEFFDLIMPAGGQRLRYRRSSENPPTTIENRWYCILTAAFNDLTPIENLPVDLTAFYA